MLRTVASNLAREALLHRTRTNAIASTSSSSSFQSFRSSSSFMNTKNINKQISTSSSNLFAEEQQQQQEQEDDKMGEDKKRYNKSSGPVAKLLHLIFKNQPIDSQKLYQLAVENAVEIHSRRHMKILLQSIKSRKQFTTSENNNNTNKNKKKKKRFDGFIKAARPFDASGKTTKVTYTFSVEERGRKHLEKLGLIEARAEEEGNNNNSE
ncbi:unnamed protein product [Bathycoccus prasinos]